MAWQRLLDLQPSPVQGTGHTTSRYFVCMYQCVYAAFYVQASMAGFDSVMISCSAPQDSAVHVCAGEHVHVYSHNTKERLRHPIYKSTREMHNAPSSSVMIPDTTESARARDEPTCIHDNGHDCTKCKVLRGGLPPPLLHSTTFPLGSPRPYRRPFPALWAD